MLTPGGGGVPQGILGGGVPTRSPNPDVKKKCNFPHLFSDLAFRQKLCYHYLDWRANTKIIQLYLEFAHFSFFLTHL